MNNLVFDSNRYAVLKFFSYPCVVVDRIDTYEVICWTKEPRTKGNIAVRDFFLDVLKYADTKMNKDFMDNKIAFKIYDRIEKYTFYVGYKDNIYAVGPCLNPYVESSFTVDIDNE